MSERYIALDLETTGLRPQLDRILEIGALKVENGEVTGTYETFLDHQIEIPPEITRLTGITREMVAGSAAPAEAIAGFLEFSGALPLLGHNILFDYGFMKQAVVNLGGTFERRGMDTLAIARSCLPDLPGKSLDRVAAWYGIPQEHHHRALDDALTAARVYERLKEEFAEGRPELFVSRPLMVKQKKDSPITNPQKRYLRELLKYHRIEIVGRREAVPGIEVIGRCEASADKRRDSATDPDSRVREAVPGIEEGTEIDSLTKSEASRLIDRIILQYGKMTR